MYLVLFHRNKNAYIEQAKSSDDKSSTGLKFVIGRLLRWNFRPMAVYPPIAPSTFRWFRSPTGHGPATLPCDAVEPPTTRQIDDSSTFNRIVIGVWSVGYRKHRTLISGSSADDRSGSGQIYISEENPTKCPPSHRWSSCHPPTSDWSVCLATGKCHVCPVTFPSLSAITRMSSDEVHMKLSYQCPTSVLSLSDNLPDAPITLLLVTHQHHLCVTNWNVSDQYPTKLVGSEKSAFPPAPGQTPASVHGGHKNHISFNVVFYSENIYSDESIQTNKQYAFI